MSRVAPSETDSPRWAMDTDAPPQNTEFHRSPERRLNKHYPYLEEDYGTAYKYDPEYKGPTDKRGCTDIVCLGLFIAFLCGWGFVAYTAVSQGDISKIIYPTNTNGDICGKGEFKNRSVLLFFDLTRCLNPAVIATGCPTKQICISECPSFQYTMYGAVKSGKDDLQIKEQMRPFCEKISDVRWNDMTAKELLDNEICPPWILPSTNVIGRCLPSIVQADLNEPSNPNSTIFSQDDTPEGKKISEATLTNAVTQLGAFLSVRTFGERVFSDLSATWWMILLAFFAAMVISFVWIVLMRFFAGFMVWTSIGLILCFFGSLFGFCLYRYDTIKNMPSAQYNIFQVNFTPDYFDDVLALRDTWLAFTIISGIIFFVLLLLIIALRQRILIAVELIEEGSKVVANQMSTLAFPLFPFVLRAIVALFFLTVALHLSSSGEKQYKVAYVIQNVKHDVTAVEIRALKHSPARSCRGCNNPINSEPFKLDDTCDPKFFLEKCQGCPEISCQFTKYVKNNDVSWMQFYNLVGFYWGIFFAAGLSDIILAGVFARWYWTRKKSDVPCCALNRAFRNAVFFHLGTAAFGSLIITIVRVIRVILSWIADKLKLHNNELTRCLICMCKCCLYLLEKFLRFINRNAYIMCAIKGTNFCSSASQAFSLLMRNILRVVVLDRTVSVLLFVGKIVIVAGSGCLAYFVFSGGIPNIKDDIPTLNYYQTPIVVICLGSYLITSLFFGVYEMAVDTLFLCFLEDLERNDGSREKPYFMSKGLQKVLGKMQRYNED